jgi:hypothetical protein
VVAGGGWWSWWWWLVVAGGGWWWWWLVGDGTSDSGRGTHQQAETRHKLREPYGRRGEICQPHIR